MEARSLLVALALIAAPAAIFRRRNKDEWLGELDGIRTDALGGAGDEIGPAMARSHPAPGNDVAEPSEPPPVTEPTVEVVDQPMGSSEDHVESTSSEGHVESNSEVRPVFATRAPKPAPNRDRPSELWHAPLEFGALGVPPEIAPEERIGSTDVIDPSPAGTEVLELVPMAPGRGGQPTDPLVDPPVDVVAGSEFGDPSDTAGPRDRATERPPRLRPPTDIFDAAPMVVPDLDSTAATSKASTTGTSAPTAGLVGRPVGRRPTRATSQRSLFGGGAVLPVQQGPAAEPVEISELGEVVDERGTIRVAERTRPVIVRSPSDDSLSIDSGWCWVNRATTMPPVRITLPKGVLVIPGATRALAVVENDHSTFVSVVAGTAHLEHPTGLVPLATGSISHVPLEGDVTVDAASPDEMASDAILTRNLRMDDALDAITGLRRRSSSG